MPERTCSIEGCEGIAGRPGTARGWCSKHYNRWQRWGDPLGGRPLKNKGKVCSIDGCATQAHSMGWCVTHYSRYYRKGDPLHRLAGEVVDGKRICPTCGEDKPRTTDYWYAAKRSTDGLAGDCKECAKRRRREGRNPERERIYRRTPEQQARAAERARRRRRDDPDVGHDATRRRRARKAAVHSEPYRRMDIAERDGWRCGLCGCPILPFVRYPHPRSLSIDHVVPLSRGGPDAPDNVHATHLRCNLRKYASFAT